MNLSEPPLIKMYDLVLKPEKQAEYLVYGKRNLELSIQTEPQTLAMHALQKENDAFHKVVFEIYSDITAQKRHQNAPQFKKYAAFAKDALVEKNETELIPELLLEKADFLSGKTHAPLLVRLARLTIKDRHMAAFKAAVFSEMRQAISLEAGVLAMYATSLKNEPDTWLFLEFYQNEAAYQTHLKTPHFEEYLAKTKNALEKKELQTLQEETLVSQGNIDYERKR